MPHQRSGAFSERKGYVPAVSASHEAILVVRQELAEVVKTAAGFDPQSNHRSAFQTLAMEASTGAGFILVPNDL